MKVTPIRIIVVEDHLIVGNALKDMINKFENCKVIKVLQNGLELIDFLEKSNEIDVVISDLNMPVMNGYDTASWIQQHRPAIHMIAVTMYNNEFLFMELMDLGFKAMLSKNTSARELEAAINTVYADEHYFENVTSAKWLGMINKNNSGIRKKSRSFTRKEIEILKLLVTDLSYKEIAAKLKISIRSVEAYKESFCEKFSVKSRIGITSYALQNGLIIN